MFLQILAVIAEFEANLIRQRTREGIDIARQHGKQPRLKPAQDREIRRMHDSGDYNVTEIAALFSVSRPTVYRSLKRTTDLPRCPPASGPCVTSPGTTRCSSAVLADKGRPCLARVVRPSRQGEAGHRATSTLDGDGTPALHRELLNHIGASMKYHCVGSPGCLNVLTCNVSKMF
jgi:hypothetical protein